MDALPKPTVLHGSPYWAWMLDAVMPSFEHETSYFSTGQAADILNKVDAATDLRLVANKSPSANQFHWTV